MLHGPFIKIKLVIILTFYSLSFVTITTFAASSIDPNNLRYNNKALSQIVYKYTQPNMSDRVFSTERPYIEDVLDKYCSIEGVIPLALGSSHWQPPEKALQMLIGDVSTRNTQVWRCIIQLQCSIETFCIPKSRRGFPKFTSCRIVIVITKIEIRLHRRI